MATKQKNEKKIQMRGLPFALGCLTCSEGGFRTISYNAKRVIVQHVNSPKCENNDKMYSFAPFLIDVQEL